MPELHAQLHGRRAPDANATKRKARNAFSTHGFEQADIRPSLEEL